MHAPSRSYTTKKPDSSSVLIENPPADSVSDIAFNSTNNYMAVSSWDSTVRIYAMPPIMSSFSTTRSFRYEKVFQLQQPVLSVAFFGPSVVAGLVDGTLVVLDMSGNKNVIQAHSLGVKRVRNFNDQFIVTGSFDLTVKFWDMKSNNPLHTITLPSKVYSLDLQGNLLAIMLADRSVHLYNINDINSPVVFPLRFNYSPRSVSISSDMDSIAVGGIESKIHIFSRSIETKKVTFRGHRVNQRLYSVNLVKFVPGNVDGMMSGMGSPESKIVITGGADGSLIAFDKANHMKINSIEFPAPVTAGELTPDGQCFVFATGDDWSRGYTSTPTETKLHYVDVKSFVSSR